MEEREGGREGGEKERGGREGGEREEGERGGEEYISIRIQKYQVNIEPAGKGHNTSMRFLINNCLILHVQFNIKQAIFHENH